MSASSVQRTYICSAFFFLAVLYCFLGALRPHTDKFFPPALEDLLAWSTLFRSRGTFGNYMAHVRTACIVAKASTEVSKSVVVASAVACNVKRKVFEHPALSRAKMSVQKAGNFRPRPRMWLQRDMVERIVQHCNSSSELRPFGLLYLLTYAFLLRLPSEALPTRLGIAGLHVDGETMVLTLARRQVS